jgi:hypothetical protein
VKLQVRFWSTLFSLWPHRPKSEAIGGESQRVQHLLRDVCKLESTHFAFAAILADGRVVTWGQPEDGGDSQSEQRCECKRFVFFVLSKAFFLEFAHNSM